MVADEMVQVPKSMLAAGWIDQMPLAGEDVRFVRTNQGREGTRSSHSGERFRRWRRNMACLTSADQSGAAFWLSTGLAPPITAGGLGKLETADCAGEDSGRAGMAH
jgi:hypothetical protein